MSKLKFELDKAGVGQLLKSQEMQGVLNGYAAGIAARAGEGYEMDTFVGFDRAHAIVKPVTSEARQDNLENNTLLKAVR